MQPRSPNAASLLPGEWVGHWRIIDSRGCGSFGAVYLAEGKAGPVALKLALHPRDARFRREVELLSRLRHPAVPRLIEYGEWESPAGQPHPYFAMQWVEGLPLYEWARVRAPSSWQVLQLLASLARALEATHAVGGVHRDVKGDNVLVRLKDDQAFLIDFGSCSYKGATAMTGPVFPPGTRQYRSPEAVAFAVNIQQSATKVYAAGPADDVFALGVTAYRLVTGEYPPTADPLDEGVHVWQEGGSGPVPARELNPECSPELSALISRMLSREPGDRVGARELARALERAAREDAPRTSVRNPRPWLVVGAAVMGLAGLLLRGPGREHAGPVYGGELDGGSVAVGEEALAAGVESAHEPSAMSPIAMEVVPSKPLPGQVRPDGSGRCPPAESVVIINGGCWLKTREDPKNCDEGYVHQGACYVPLLGRSRPATSAPVETRDGG